jgi:glycosyltransferase involved in cell wall biosynthesis
MSDEIGIPIVSVVMPMRNAERYVEASLQSLLVQREVDLEVVVVDDGSQDRSAAIVRELADGRVHLVKSEGEGIAAALNKGLAMCRGVFAARCDADDLFPLGRLARHVNWLTQHPDIGAICGSFSTIDAKGKPVQEMRCGATAEEISEELRAGNIRTHLGTYTIRREVLIELGGFRSYFDGCEDIDLQLRLVPACRVWYEPSLSYVYRLHDASVTHRRQKTKREWLDATARLFADQRRQYGMDDLQRGSPPTLPAPDSSSPVSASEHVRSLLTGKGWEYHRGGQMLKAIGSGLRACSVRPTSVAAWRNLAALMVKRPNRSSRRRGGGDG